MVVETETRTEIKTETEMKMMIEQRENKVRDEESNITETRMEIETGISLGL